MNKMRLVQWRIKYYYNLKKLEKGIDLFSCVSNHLSKFKFWQILDTEH